jgi:hypothetical protein
MLFLDDGNITGMVTFLQSWTPWKVQAKRYIIFYSRFFLFIFACMLVKLQFDYFMKKSG